VSGHRWLPAEDQALRTLYPHIRTVDIVPILGRKIAAIYGRATMLGLEKSEAFKASALSGRNVKGHAPHGAATRFKPGHVSKNKGLRRPGWFAGRMRETQFRKGQTPFNKCELGDLRMNTEGYVDMKISNERGAKAWRTFHRILWEDVNGPVPENHVLVFKDKDRLNICLENIELITRAELQRRNTLHRLPKPLVQAILSLGQLKRRIREQDNRRAA
jgi:hypothetical protein